MEPQKTINSLQKTSDNKDLLIKGTKKKKNYSNNKKVKMGKPITFFAINYDSIV